MATGGVWVRRVAWVAGVVASVALPGLAVASPPAAGVPLGERGREAVPPLPPIQPLRPGEGEPGGGGLPVIPPETTGRVAPGLATRPAAAGPSFRLGDVRFEGGSVFSREQLLRAPVVTREDAQGRPVAEVTVGDYLGREVTSDDLEQIRQAITRFYVGEGYINSGAVLPDQDIQADGVVTYQLVEGRLTDINPAGNKFLSRRYLLGRVERGAKSPLNVRTLQNELELLRQNPNIRRVNAELRPGAVPGEATLDVNVEEASARLGGYDLGIGPAQLGFQFSNRRSPSVGAEQLEVLASHRSLTGNGDALSVRYGVNTGGLDRWAFAGADDFSIDYSVPVAPDDTALLFSFTRTDQPVVEEAFRALDIASELNSVALTLRHPLWRTQSGEFALFAGLAYRDNKTFLLGEPFSFSPGADAGRSAVTAVRFGPEFVTRNQRSALSVRSTFSLGVDAFGATQHSDEALPDGQFFAWLGQFQYVARLEPLLGPGSLIPRDTTFVVRLSTQLTTHPLPAIEQFAVGGFDTVRGYRENQIVRDNAAVGSLELHVPLVQNSAGESVFELVPFFDVGRGWNDASYPTGRAGQTLASVGAGLQFTPDRHLSASVYYGFRLRDLGEPKDTSELQDHGIHFSILYLAF